jgi:formate dehydrogenase beta subunit
VIVRGERPVQIVDELVAIQIRGDRRVQATFCDELAQVWKADRQRSQELTKGLGFDLDFRDASAFARDAEELDVHGVTLIGPVTPSKGKGPRVRPIPKGRAVDTQARQQVATLLGDAPRRRDLLIEFLHLIQDHFGCLSAPHLVALAAEMKMAMAEVYEVATFYHHFDVVKEGDTPPPALTVRVCDSIACELAGSQQLLRTLPGVLGATVRVLHAPCVGRCDAAPVAVVGQNPVPHATVDRIVSRVQGGEIRHSPSDPEVTPGHVDYAAYRTAGGYSLAASCLNGQRTAADVIALMEDSGLRGLGGAGFPAGRKWRIVAAEPAPRLLAINIDEGEPGTFKDRYYLERDPHRFVEGAIVAAWAVGIDDVYIYVRDEYHGCRAILQRELDSLAAAPPCPIPRFHLRRGAGAYICGEESAMIESIEGKRGEPRLRPPYVAQVGLFGRPTLEHNMETLHWVRDIIENGPAWFTSHGRHGRKGLRSFSVSGRVKRPGVHTLYGYLPGGASGGILPASLANVPLDFDTLAPHGCFIGSAAVIVLSDKDRAAAAARNVMRFFADESCGQCTPCRVGTQKAVDLMNERRWNKPLLEELSQAMMDASICGLGQAAPNPVLSVLKYFPSEVE